jgi:hypothetical protein
LFPATPTKRSLRSTTRARSPSLSGDDKDIEPLVFKTPRKQLRFVDAAEDPKPSKKKAEASSSKDDSPVKAASKGKVSLMDRTLEGKEKKGQTSTATAAITSGKGATKNKRL